MVVAIDGGGAAGSGGALEAGAHKGRRRNAGRTQEG